MSSAASRLTSPRWSCCSPFWRRSCTVRPFACPRYKSQLGQWQWQGHGSGWLAAMKIQAFVREADGQDQGVGGLRAEPGLSQRLPCGHDAIHPDKSCGTVVRELDGDTAAVFGVGQPENRGGISNKSTPARQTRPLTRASEGIRGMEADGRLPQPAQTLQLPHRHRLKGRGRGPLDRSYGPCWYP